MQQFFDRRDRWGNSPAVWIVAAIAFVLPVVGSSLQSVRMDNKLDKWLATSDPNARTNHWYQELFPQSDRVIVTWEGSTLDDPRTDLFVENLYGHVDADGMRRGQSPFVDGVMTAREAIERFAEYDVSVEDAVDRLDGTLIGKGWIKVQLTSAGLQQRARTERALQQLGDALGVAVEFHPPLGYELSEEQLTAMEDEAVAETIGSDESSGETETLEPSALEAGLLTIPDHDLQITWKGYSADSRNAADFVALASDLRGLETAEEPAGQQLVESCFMAIGSPLAVVIKLSEAGSADRHAAVASIREAADAAGIPAESLHLGGEPIVGCAMDSAVAKSAWNSDGPIWAIHDRSTMALSGLVGILLAFVFLRSVRLGLLVVSISYLCSALTVALLPATGSTLNMVLIVMPTLLMTITLSEAIHFVNYWRYSHVTDPENPIRSALEKAYLPCVMACLTTAVGLVSLVNSDLLPVRQFGLYSSIGCIISLGIILYLLPALLEMLKLKARPFQEREGRVWTSTGNWLSTHRRLVYGAHLAVFIACIAGLYYFRTETRAIRYFTPESEVVQDYTYLEQNLAGVTPIDAVIRFTPDAQQRLRFLQRLEIVREIGDQLKAHEDITGTTSLANFRSVFHAPPPTAPRLELVRYNRTSNDVERHIKENLAEGAGEFIAIPETGFDLNTPGDNLLNGKGDELWRIAAQTIVQSSGHASILTAEMDDIIQSQTRFHPGVSHVVTGSMPLFLRTQQAVLNSLIAGFLGEFVIITGMMIYVLRHFRSGIVSMLPTVFPVGVMFGAIAWAGMSIDIGTMVTASVALGIAVDSGLHLLTWFKDALRRGDSREQAVAESLRHCGPAMCQTTAVVSLGMLMLWPTELLLISRFGWIMSAMIFLSLIGNVVLLPSLLAGGLGSMLEKVVLREAMLKAAAAVESNHIELQQDVEASDQEIAVGSPSACPSPHFITLKETAKTGRRKSAKRGKIDA